MDPRGWKCSKCGNWNTKYMDRCSFCNEEAPILSHLPPTISKKTRNPTKDLKERTLEDRINEAPRVQVETYVCPGCLEDSLIYGKAERYFTCTNKDCGRWFALTEVSRRGNNGK